MIIKEGIQSKIDKILLRKTMATAMDDTPQGQGERKFRMLRDSSHLNLDQIRQFIDILGKIRQFLGLRVLGNKL